MTEDKVYGVDIIKEMELDKLPDEQKEEIIAALSQALQTRITNRIMQILTDAEKNELEVLVTAGDEQKTGEFITSHVPGLDAIGYDELQKLRLEVKSMNEDVMAAIEGLKK
jgi:hypothetical protein